MCKLYNEPIVVQKPNNFIWRGQRYYIDKIIKRWTVNEKWWNPKLASEKYFALVSANNRCSSGIYEIYYFKQHNQWYLSRVYD